MSSPVPQLSVGVCVAFSSSLRASSRLMYGYPSLNVDFTMPFMFTLALPQGRPASEPWFQNPASRMAEPPKSSSALLLMPLL